MLCHSIMSNLSRCLSHFNFCFPIKVLRKCWCIFSDLNDLRENYIFKTFISDILISVEYGLKHDLSYGGWMIVGLSAGTSHCIDLFNLASWSQE